jgi:hypothetical protein
MKRKYRAELKKIDEDLDDEDFDDEDFDDETWVAKKKDFWKKNNITPIKIKGNSITPEELAKLLAENFDK